MQKLSLFAPFLLLITAVQSEEEADVASLIRQLSSTVFNEREEAEAKLLKLSGKAIPALELNKDSDDLEVRTRVARILGPAYINEQRNGDNAWVAAGCRPSLGAGVEKSKTVTPAQLPEQPKTGMLRRKRGENIDQALAWLSSTQEEDGHWDSVKFGAQEKADLEQTTLALLAFLSAGNSELVGDHKKEVQRAVEWLKRHQREDGGFVRPGSKIVEGVSHALAAMTMAEAGGIGNIKDTQVSAQRATDYSAQIHQCGSEVKSGFGRTQNSSAPDLFTTTIFIMHLKSSKVAGLNVPAKSFDGVIQFLDKMDDKDLKSFRPIAGEAPTVQATFMGCLGRQFLGYKREELQEYLEPAIVTFGNPEYNTESTDILSNYFGVLCVFQQGGDIWKSWSRAMVPSLAGSQFQEGNFRGSWNPCGRWAGGGRVLATSVNVLCLSVYERYLQYRQNAGDSPE